MTETPDPKYQGGQWHPVDHPCPKCAQPFKVRTTPSVVRITECLCSNCGWRLNLEDIRAYVKSIAAIAEAPPTEDNETGTPPAA